MGIIIETKRLFIKEITFDNLDALLEIYQDAENLKFIPNSDCEWTKEKLKKKYDTINQGYKNGFGVFSVWTKSNDILIGEAGFFDSFHNLKHLELGYILDNKFWGKGYGTEICASLIEYGFNTLKVEKLTARMFKKNIASIRLSEKIGMTLVKQTRTDVGDICLEYELKNEDV